MIAVLQRVSSASCEVDGIITGSCQWGLMILCGVAAGDTVADAEALALKISKLRIFEDDAGKMNLSVADVGGGALVVSNFTLLADYRHGNRPSFTGAAAPDEAKRLYLHFSAQLAACGIPVENGIFGADMRITLCNDGPVTLTLDSKVLLGKAGS